MRRFLVVNGERYEIDPEYRKGVDEKSKKMAEEDRLDEIAEIENEISDLFTRLSELKEMGNELK